MTGMRPNNVNPLAVVIEAIAATNDLLSAVIGPRGSIALGCAQTGVASGEMLHFPRAATILTAFAQGLDLVAISTDLECIALLAAAVCVLGAAFGLDQDRPSTYVGLAAACVNLPAPISGCQALDVIGAFLALQQVLIVSHLVDAGVARVRARVRRFRGSAALLLRARIGGTPWLLIVRIRGSVRHGSAPRHVVTGCVAVADCARKRFGALRRSRNRQEGSNAASRTSGVTLLEDSPGGDELGPPAQRRRIELSARCVAGRTGHLGRTGEDGRGARHRADHRAGAPATDRAAGRLARWTQPG